MLRLLARIFIKNHNDLNDLKVRASYGTLCSIVCIALNAALFGGKYAIGILSGSIAISADAFNNLADAGSSVIMLISFYFAGKKPTPDRPFGHGRIEYIAGLGISAMIIVTGFEFARTSIAKIIHPESVTFSVTALAVLLLAVAVKIFMALFLMRTGRLIDSPAIRATGRDSFVDVLSTAIAAFTMILLPFTTLHIDGWCGALVSLIILYAGLRSAKETLYQLLGQRPDPEFVRQIEQIVMSYDEIIGIHDLVVHDYGPGRLMVSLHAEVPGNGDIYLLHDAIDRAMANLDHALGCESVIHMDPVCTDDKRIEAMRSAVAVAIGAFDSGVTIHDFRIVEGPTHTNIIYDAVVPRNFRLSNEQVKIELTRITEGLFDNAFAVITIDNPYI